MSSKFLSALTPISYGLVAENKLLDSNTILVIPVEITPFVEGDVNGDVEDLESKGTDSDEIEYTIKVKKSKVIKAKWLKWGGQRTTAPDVRKNMRVMIYRFADSDKYYWTSLGLDDHLYRLETVQWLFSDDPDGLSDDDRNPDNSISFVVSTHDKHITITTPNSNGERFKYTIKLDLQESIFTLTDDADNYLFLDSANTHIKFRNADETYMELNKEDINMYAPNDFNLVAAEHVTVQCKNLSVTVDEAVVVEVGTDVSMTIGGDSVSTVGGDYILSASGVSITASTFSMGTDSANIEAGSIGLKGALVVDGESTFTKPMSAAGIASTGPVSAPGHPITP